MSEFYFDYKCISLNPDAPKDEHALQFFLFQDYKNGNMNVRVYVPKEKQKLYERVNVYQCEHGIDFKDLEIFNDRFLSDSYAISGSDNAVDRENGFTISPQGNNLSGIGVIAFIRNGKNKPEIEDCYKFAINYSKREVISYRVLERSRAIRIEIRYPRLLKPIDLCVVRKSGSKPLLIGDKKNVNNIIKDDKNKDVIITLKAMGKEFEWETKDIPFPKGSTSCNDFRLFFVNDEDNEFYMLDDESDFTIEDQKERKKAIARKKNKSARREYMIKCPYCNYPIPETVRKAKEGVFNCHGVTITKDTGIRGIGNGKKAIVCAEDLVKLSKKNIAINNLILPDKADVLPTMNIAVAGFPKCGKTVYLASIINMFAAHDGSYNASPFILSNIVEHFSRTFAKDKGVEMTRMLGYVKDNKERQIDETQEKKRSTEVEGLNVLGRYSINVGQNLESHTLADHAEPLSWNPVGFRMGELGFVYLYDVPGESFSQKTINTSLRTLNVADGIIAVIDGEQLSASRAAGKEKNERTINPINDLNNTLKAISSLAPNKDLTNVPIAIVFTKLDLKIRQYIDEADQNVVDKCFDDNCHILREDMISLFPKNKRYRGSELERHIDCASYEIQHFLKNLNVEERSVYEEIIKKYHNIKFFACSSVGSNSVFENSSESAGIKRRPRRLRIELPLLWLMHKNGLVRD